MTLLYTLQTTPWLYFVWVIVISLIVGSFLNVVIYRLPRMIARDETAYCRDLLRSEKLQTFTPTTPFNLTWPLSHCPHCKQGLKPWHNIPVISFLLLRGRCASCKRPIAWRYPLVELLTAIVSVIAAARFGVSGEAIVAIVFSWVCLPMIFIDLDHHLLPDSLTLSLLWIGLFVSLFHGIVSPSTAIIGALSGYLAFWIIAHVFFWITGKEGLGGGDAKLLAAIGAWIGWWLLPIVVLIASVLGCVVAFLIMLIQRRDLRGVPIPFGPFLILAGWVCVLWGPAFVNQYLHWMGIFV